MGYNSTYRLKIISEPDIALHHWHKQWLAPTRDAVSGNVLVNGGGYAVGAPVMVEVFESLEPPTNSFGSYPAIILNRRTDSRFGFCYQVSFDPTGLSKEVVERLSPGWVILTGQIKPIIERTSPEQVKVIIKELCQGSEDADYVLADDGSPNERGRWDTKELVEYSKKYPDILFKLEVEGQENTDLWHLYVNNGKSQKCKANIKYPKFKPKKLV